MNLFIYDYFERNFFNFYVYESENVCVKLQILVNSSRDNVEEAEFKYINIPVLKSSKHINYVDSPSLFSAFCLRSEKKNAYLDIKSVSF